jgi:hypothetical protein
MIVKRNALAAGFQPTPAEDLIYHGGKTIKDLTFTNLYIGDTAAWPLTDIASIDKSLAAAMGDAGLNAVMSQYFGNAPITATFKPSRVLRGTPTPSFSHGDVVALVKALVKGGELAGFDFGSTVFNLILPKGTTLTTDLKKTHAQTSGARREPALGAQARNVVRRAFTARAGRALGALAETTDSSLAGLGGYHGSVHVTKPKATIYYAISVYSEGVNGIVAFDQPWKNIVATSYHELQEVRTDPDVEDSLKQRSLRKATRLLGWVSASGNEVGDFPMSEAGADLAEVMQEVPLADGSGTVPLQFMYSNRVHGPEGAVSLAQKQAA